MKTLLTAIIVTSFLVLGGSAFTSAAATEPGAVQQPDEASPRGTSKKAKTSPKSKPKERSAKKGEPVAPGRAKAFNPQPDPPVNGR